MRIVMVILVLLIPITTYAGVVRRSAPGPEPDLRLLNEGGRYIDADGDGISNYDDSCAGIPNPNQKDSDGDLWGDACDNCSSLPNFDQKDSNNNGIGDACESIAGDLDGDGIPDEQDRCPSSDFGPTVVIGACNSDVTNHRLGGGCMFSDLFVACAANTNDHGQFMSCVASVTDTFKNDGTISDSDEGKIQNCAAGGTSDNRRMTK